MRKMLLCPFSFRLECRVADEGASDPSRLIEWGFKWQQNEQLVEAHRLRQPRSTLRRVGKCPRRGRYVLHENRRRLLVVRGRRRA